MLIRVAFELDYFKFIRFICGKKFWSNIECRRKKNHRNAGFYDLAAIINEQCTIKNRE